MCSGAVEDDLDFPAIHTAHQFCTAVLFRILDVLVVPGDERLAHFCSTTATELEWFGLITVAIFKTVIWLAPWNVCVHSDQLLN